MSKIPLADEPSSKENEGNQKFFSKGFWIAFSITLAILLGIGSLIAYIEYLTIDNLFVEAHPYLHIITDGAGLSGLIGVLIFALTYLSSSGAFDFLSYSVQLLVLNIFNPKYRKESFPKTYYDYRVLKDSQKRKPIFGILFASLPMLVAGIILLVIYNSI